MKLFGTLFTTLTTDALAHKLCLSQWQCTKVESNHYHLISKSVNLTLEGDKDVLLYGELTLELTEIDDWVEVISKQVLSYNIDIHGAEARLLRRYQG